MKWIFTPADALHIIHQLTRYLPTLKDRKYVMEIKEHREKRSLDANAYCFVLIDKIAAELGLDKTTVYRNAIRDISGNNDIVCIKEEAADSLRRGWGHNGLGWITDTLPSKIDGCTNIVLYYGSSTYDSKQMSTLIDHVVQDAKALGIETLPPHKIKALEDSWNAKT